MSAADGEGAPDSGAAGGVGAAPGAPAAQAAPGGHSAVGAVPAESPEHDDVAALLQGAGDGVLAVGADRGEATVLVAAEAMNDIAPLLRERGYNMLTSLTAVDYRTSKPRFHVVYLFTAIPPWALAGRPSAAGTGEAPRRLRVKAAVPAEAPVVPSITSVYPTANWHEREVWDMFGIEFAGHPDLRRILMPDDYDGHPLRKDHPLGYEEVAFTHNVAAVQARKSFATE